MAPDLRKTWLHRVFMGPQASFHNQNRKWLYLGFLAVILALVCAVAVRNGG